VSARYDVVGSRRAYTGFSSVRIDDLVGPGGEAFQREVVEHPDAVAVVAIDEEERVVLVRQYRHPLRATLLELPAGTLDVEGESALDAARRELAEEVGLAARCWQPLGALWNSAGWSDERTWLFLATDVRPAPRPAGYHPEGEEADLTIERIALSELLGMCADGRIDDAKTVAGVLRASVHLPGTLTR
jgi:8-oxo-dGTP pyrophosphatase MutT (NUDIX family)